MIRPFPITHPSSLDSERGSTNRFVLERRVRQLTSELNQLDGTSTEDMEARSRALIRRIVALVAQLVSSEYLTDRDETNSVVLLAIDAVQRALIRIHGVPLEEVEGLVPSWGSTDRGVLSLAQWALLLPAAQGDGGSASATTTTTTMHDTLLFVKKHHATRINFAKLPAAEPDEKMITSSSTSSTSAAPTRNAGKQRPSSLATSTADLRESAVDAVRRGILDLKHGARLLQTQLGGEQTLLDENEALLKTSLTNTTSQTRQVDTVSGGGSGKRWSSRVPLLGFMLQRVPGVAFVWDHVLVPLWHVVRHALLIAVVLFATVVTVWMMLVVPRAYVRVQ